MLTNVESTTFSLILIRTHSIVNSASRFAFMSGPSIIKSKSDVKSVLPSARHETGLRLHTTFIASAIAV